MTPPRKLPRWSAAMVAAIGVMGVVLVGVVWTTHSSAQAAQAQMIRGQAAEAHGAVRARMMDLGDDPMDRRTAAALDAAGNGLLYLASLDADGAIVAEAGHASANRAALATWIASAKPGVPVRIGDRVRVVFRRTPRPNDPPRPPGYKGPAGLVLELDPHLADELGRNARWTLVVGVVAALTLLVLAAVVVRWSLRREATVRAMEQARHLASLGQMSAVLAHEIRNPLASLKGNAQLLARSLPEGDRPRAKADRVVDEAVRLEHLTNDLLQFARTGEIRLSDADPAALLRDAAAAVDGARVHVADDGAPRSWPLDADRIRQVLVNLLENAVEISEGPVDAAVARADGALRFTIRDHGPGFADTDMDRLFEPFFTKRVRGTGLGLAVCKRLVDLHGGTIVAGNAAGGGAEFRITLPRGA